MKQHLTIKMTRIAIAAVMIFSASAAMASGVQGASDINPDESTFQLVPLELPDISSDIAVDFPSKAYFRDLLEELTNYQEESRPLIRDINSKWGDLTDELSKHHPASEKIAGLQAEISALDAQLATMRLHHLQAMNKIKASSDEVQLLAAR
jgi:hypothetical protein